MGCPVVVHFTNYSVSFINSDWVVTENRNSINKYFHICMVHLVILFPSKVKYMHRYCLLQIPNNELNLDLFIEVLFFYRGLCTGDDVARVRCPYWDWLRAVFNLWTENKTHKHLVKHTHTLMRSQFTHFSTKLFGGNPRTRAIWILILMFTNAVWISRNETCANICTHRKPYRR